jgi:hypothetical protein
LGQIDGYAALFRDDVKVYENDQQVANNRGEWIAYLKVHAGVHSTVLKMSYGNPIMVAETLNNISYRGPNVVQDCCIWARIALYHLDQEQRVDVVRFQTNGSFWGSPGQPQ